MALVDGKIDGSVYKGECACLKGTIANARHVDVDKFLGDLRPNSSEPAEVWFMSIHKGDTPESNQISGITKTWLEEFMVQNEIKIPTRTVSWL